jgi:hypothetical protein
LGMVGSGDEAKKRKWLAEMNDLGRRLA